MDKFHSKKQKKTSIDLQKLELDELKRKNEDLYIQNKEFKKQIA